MKMHMATCINKTAFGVDHHENRGPHATLGRALGMGLMDPYTNRDVVCVALTNQMQHCKYKICETEDTNK